MARYDYGMNRGFGPRRGDWSDPNGGAAGSPYDRGHAGNRPWVGGYRDGYQGGSGGMRTGGTGRGGMDPGARRGYGSRPTPYGRDYWWLGEHELRREGRHPQYDEAYRRFDEQTHPRFSPVGGMYGAMGGRYAYGRSARPLREDTWFSDWTRWF